MNKNAYIGFLVVIAIVACMFGYMNRPVKTTSPAGVTPAAPPGQDPTLSSKQVAAMYPQLIKMAVAPPLGNPNAKWNVVEIGDFQCPNCGKAEPLVLDAIKASGGKAKLFFVNFPLPTIHPHAVLAAEAGEAAAAQGKFWPMYRMLYAHQDELIDSEIEYNARTIPGMNTTRLASDLNSEKYLPAVEQQISTINAMGVESVPTVIVRSPTGHFTWYIGTGGDKITPGIVKLAAQSPWGGGIGQAQAQSLLASENAADAAGSSDN